MDALTVPRVDGVGLHPGDSVWPARTVPWKFHVMDWVQLGHFGAWQSDRIFCRNRCLIIDLQKISTFEVCNGGTFYCCWWARRTIYDNLIQFVMQDVYVSRDRCRCRASVKINKPWPFYWKWSSKKSQLENHYCPRVPRTCTHFFDLSRNYGSIYHPDYVE